MNQCFADQLGCSVEITRSSGAVDTYNVDGFDSACGLSHPLISFATMNPMLESIACLYAKRDSGTAESPGVVPRDARCWNGVFMGGPGTVLRRLRADQGNLSARVELLGCQFPDRRGKIAFKVVDPGSGETLAAGLPLTDLSDRGTCAQADVAFPAAGLYPLEIEILGDFGPLGDLYLRYF